MVNFNPETTSGLLGQVQKQQNTLMERLASGRRVNSAADDAAGLQIINRLNSQVEGNRQAISNAYDGISVAQVAEGGLANVNNDVQRIRELSIQAGNGILTDADRQALQSEISQLQDNISQTIERTEFAGKPLLSEDSDIAFQVGANPEQQVNLQTRDIAASLGDILAVDVTTASGAEQALDAADEALEFVGQTRAEFGATQNRFESAARNLTQADANVAAARGRIEDTDFAQAASQSAVAAAQSQAATLVQSQANQQQGAVLTLLT